MQIHRYIHSGRKTQDSSSDAVVPVVIRTYRNEIIQLDTATCQNNLLQIEASLPNDYELDSIQVLVRKRTR